tara:strand:- start:818 stop:2176 length:1359 start_codon:yes stop_codon:yes gene_type:complete
MKILKWLYKFLGSLQFAVLVILALAIISAVGTIIESKYNAEIAQAIVYKSPYMIVALICLSVSLILSALHRWPWRRKHIPFLVAHIGLLVLIFGSWLTMRYGIDGTLVLGADKSNQFVSVPQREVKLFMSQDGDGFVSLINEKVDFYKNPPNMSIDLPDGEFKIVDYIPFALKNSKIIESEDSTRGPAVRFVLRNDRVDLSEWLLHKGTAREATMALGPATIILTKDKSFQASQENTLVLYSEGERLTYKIYYGDRPTKTGSIQEGDVKDTGWMGLKFHLINYYPRAEEKVEFIKRDYPNDLTTEAVQVEFQGQKHWVEANSLFRVFTESAGYVFLYGNQQLDIGVPLKLVDFQMEKYPGTDRAASYASLVKLVNKDQQSLISMNEPLKHNGFTFYQASYKQDELGRPIASILSVNYDPGRPWKYLGSLLVVLGACMLFYMRKYYMKKRSAS